VKGEDLNYQQIAKTLQRPEVHANFAPLCVNALTVDRGWCSPIITHNRAFVAELVA
jgi:hypothetical protein